MSINLTQAKELLEADGLIVRQRPQGLWIVDELQETENGVKLAREACLIGWWDGRLIASFPDRMRSHDIPGELSDLVELVRAVYRDLKQNGGGLKDALARTLQASPR